MGSHSLHRNAGEGGRRLEPRATPSPSFSTSNQPTEIVRIVEESFSLDPEGLVPDLTCSPPLSCYDAFAGSQALGISGCAHLSVTGNLVVQGSRAVSLGPEKGSRQRAVEAQGRGTLSTQVFRPDL